MLMDEPQQEYLCSSANWEVSVSAKSAEEAASLAVQKIVDGSKVINFPIGAMIVVIPIVKDLENLHMIYAPKILADVGLHEFSSDLIKFINE
jgi:hypothetical protein